MAAKNNDSLTLNSTGANLLRIIIASYFLAVAARLIPGTDVTGLFASVLPADIAQHAASAVVFVLAFCVTIGFWLRGAALLLALIFFWASFVSISKVGVGESLGGFWRDLALIAALIMTYAEPSPRNRSRRGIFRVIPTPRRLFPVQPQRVDAGEKDGTVASLNRASANRQAAKFREMAESSDEDVQAPETRAS